MEPNNIDSFYTKNSCEIKDSKQIYIKDEKFDEYDSVEDNVKGITKIKTELEDEEIIGMNREFTNEKIDDLYVEHSSVSFKCEDIDLKHEEIHLKYEKINVKAEDEKSVQNENVLNASNLNSYAKGIPAATEVREAGSSSFEFVDVNAVNEDRIFKCNYCHQVFLTHQFCEDHETQCNKNTEEQQTKKGKKSKCYKCNKTFVSKSNLARHKKIHTNFEQNIMADNHAGHLENRTTQYTEEKSRKCMQCEQTFVYPCHLKAHMRRHTGEKPYKCTQCDKAFTQTNILNNHMKIHSGEKQNKCSLCDQAFSQAYHLKCHMKIHTGENLFKCTLCVQAISLSYLLKRHMRIHTGEKPHKCKVCEQAFTVSGHLKRHMRIHTGEKPHKCTLCGKTFIQSGNLKYHMRRHTDEKPHNVRCVSSY